MPDQLMEFQRLSDAFRRNVNSDSGNVNGVSGKVPKIVHVRPESAFTMTRNHRSRSFGISVHVRP